MKIAKRTSTQLLVTDYPTGSWIIGSIFLVMGLYGCFMGFVSNTGSFASWAGFAVGVAFLGSGLVLLLRGRILSCCFDKDAEAFTLSHRSILRTKEETLPLSKIAKVRLEHPPKGTPEIMNGQGANGQTKPVYRVVLVLNSNQPLPLTPGYSDNRETQRSVAESIAEFLNVEADIPPGFSDLIKGLWEAIKAFFRDR